MGKRIVIIQGHPDPDPSHFCHAIGWTYEEAAVAAGHTVRTIDVARLDFELLRTQREFEKGKVPEAIREAQQDIRWADHVVVIFPLWQGTFPALLKGFFEQTFRYGFAMKADPRGKGFARLLKGRSARVIVTMGMPATAYRIMFGAHGTKSLERGILWMAGFAPIRATLLGMLGGRKPAWFARQLREIHKLGSKAA